MRTHRPYRQDPILPGLVAAALLLGAPVSAQQDVPGGTLNKIYAQDKLICGVSTGVQGFSQQDERGNYAGFDVDFCRAVAAALFGDDSKVAYVGLSSAERFDALASGKVDVLFRNTTWTLSRDISRLMDFAGINYFDGQGFLVRTDSGIDSVQALDGRQVCVQIDTTSDKNLTDHAIGNELTVERHYGQTLDENVAAYTSGACDAITTDASALAGVRASLADPAAHRVLPELISKEPLALGVRQGDDELRDVVAWTLFAMIGAEELGISQDNVEQVHAQTRNRDQRRLLGVIETIEDEENALGTILSLEPTWAYDVIRQVGNYADVFENNLGSRTAIGLERGLNALHTHGGLMYAPPLR